MSDRKPLSSLARERSSMEMYQHGWGGDWGWGYGVIGFLFVAFIVWLVLAATKPTFVQHKDSNGDPNDELDNGKALIWSVIIGIIVVVVVWGFRASTGYHAM